MAWVKTVKQDLHSYSVDQGTSKQSTDFYLVIFDAPATAIQAEMAPGVPKFGDVSPDDSTRYFKQKRPQVVENSNRMHWQVQVDYDSTVQAISNPLARPVAISWDYSDGTESYFIDNASKFGQKSNQQVVNSAGQNFEPAFLERESGKWSATWKKNVAATFTIASDVSTMQKVNNGPFTFDGNIISQYAAKISGGSLSEVQTENGVSYRVLTYKLKFQSGGWIDRIQDRGRQQLGSDGELVDIVTGPAKTPVDKTYPLDGSGHAKPNAKDDPAELDFYPYLPTDFSKILS